MLGASVIICAHNPRADYLRRVLAGLRAQTLPVEKWELLLIDNASKEPLASAWDISWHPNGRHIFESELGLTYARQSGAREASTDLLIFVDDDNVLDSHYLARVKTIGDDWPELGVWGSGAIYPEFELDPPDYLKELIPSLALRKADAIYWSNVPTCKWAAPWGAGLCVRAKVAKAYSEHSKQSAIQISGRSGTSLMSGEDIEIGYVACVIGFGMAIFPKLMLTHLIPKERITEDYLVRIVEGTLTSEYLLDYKWRGMCPRNPLTLLGSLDMLANSLVRRGIQRRVFFAQKRAARKALHIINTALSNASL